VVSFDHRRPGSVTPLDVVGKPVVDARIDFELVDATCCQLTLHRGDERPDQALPAVRGIDQHVEEARAAPGIGRSRDGEPHERRALPRSTDHRVTIRRLPPHLTL
jgi:hypothetical protein